MTDWDKYVAAEFAKMLEANPRLANCPLVKRDLEAIEHGVGTRKLSRPEPFTLDG